LYAVWLIDKIDKSSQRQPKTDEQQVRTVPWGFKSLMIIMMMIMTIIMISIVPWMLGGFGAHPLQFSKTSYT